MWALFLSVILKSSYRTCTFSSNRTNFSRTGAGSWIPFFFFSCCFYDPFISCLLPKAAQLRCADLWAVTRVDSVTLHTVFPGEGDLSRRGDRAGDLRVLCKVSALVHLLSPITEGALFVRKHQGFILFYFIFRKSI